MTSSQHFQTESPRISVTEGSPSSDRTDTRSRNFQDRPVGSTTFGDHETRSAPIPIFESRSSTPLHLELEHPSSSFRNLLTSMMIERSSSGSRRTVSRHRTVSPSPATHGPPESSWTLFGQLMETESQLRNLESPRIRPKSPRNNFESPLGSLHSFRPSSDVDPFLDTVGQPTPSKLRLDNNSTEWPISVQAQVETPVQECESDTFVDSAPTLASGTQIPPWFSLQRLTTLPILYRNILKCAVAYFLASLFTFSPYLSGFLSDITSYGLGERRPSPSGHMVATVWVLLRLNCTSKTIFTILKCRLF